MDKYYDRIGWIFVSRLMVALGYGPKASFVARSLGEKEFVKASYKWKGSRFLSSKQRTYIHVTARIILLKILVNMFLCFFLY